MNKNSKFIFVTGGVISGLGKGVAAASIGRLLKARGFSVFAQKMDPYLNIDPSLMSPIEHGEVYVTKDGGEADLDLGHYERFIGESFTKYSTFTSGKIYQEILEKERKGGFEGKTLQVIPHVTGKIEEAIIEASERTKADFIITEIGGTVGDIESEPHMHAISSFANKYKNKAFFVHITYLPFLELSKEFKTKPTQSSIKEVRKFGINPNMVILRSNKECEKRALDKIVNVSFIEKESVINLPNLKNIYNAPIFLENKKLVQQILKHFNIQERKVDLFKWKNFVNLINQEGKKEIKISMIGKYVELKDAYLSIIESLKIAAAYNKIQLNFNWIISSDIKENNLKQLLEKSDGAIILPGFGKRGFNGKVKAAGFLRDNKIPTLGICYGLQAMVIDQAKRCGYQDAVSRENDIMGTPIIDIIENNTQNFLGGTLRLGENETAIVKNTLASKIYKVHSIFERHRHRYEVNPKYKDDLEQDGFVFSGYNPKSNLSEIIEYQKHPFYIGVQFHPEFNAKPLNNHPLFDAFLKAALNNK